MYWLSSSRAYLWYSYSALALSMAKWPVSTSDCLGPPRHAAVASAAVTPPLGSSAVSSG